MFFNERYSILHILWRSGDDVFSGQYEAVAKKLPFTAQQLAHKSGYRSYSTFALAFKQRMGQTVTTWMCDSAK